MSKQTERHTAERSQFHAEKYPERFNRLWKRSLKLIKKHDAYDWWKRGLAAGKRGTR